MLSTFFARGVKNARQRADSVSQPCAKKRRLAEQTADGDDGEHATRRCGTRLDPLTPADDKPREPTVHIESFPTEILFMILDLLSPLELAVCRCVSWTFGRVARMGGYRKMKGGWACNFGAFLNRERLSRMAAKRGHLAVLMWIHGTGCRMNHRTLRAAAVANRMEVVAWLFSEHLHPLYNFYGNGYGERSISHKVAARGHLAVLAFLRTHGAGIFYSEKVPYSAAKHGHIHVLEWAVASGHVLDERAARQAAKGGHVEVIEWLESHGCPLSLKAIVKEASEGGHIPVLEWAVYKRQATLAETCCRLAAHGKHLDALKWLRDHGAPWGQDFYGSLLSAWRSPVSDAPLVEWAAEMGCPPSRVALERVAAHGMLDVLKWFHAHGHSVSTVASRCSRPEILRWLDEIGRNE